MNKRVYKAAFPLHDGEYDYGNDVENKEKMNERRVRLEPRPFQCHLVGSDLRAAKETELKIPHLDHPTLVPWYAIAVLFDPI